MAFRSMNHWKQMSTGLRRYATATSPKMKPYAPAAGATENPQQSYFKRFMRGDFVPVYVAVGMIALSVALGLHTAKQHLRYNPHVYVKKNRRETLPEVVEPERVVEESDKFIQNSFFRKVAHVQEFDDYNHAVKDPIRKDVFAHKAEPPRSKTVTLKDVGVDPIRAQPEA
ncbi:hypothetical protein ACFX2I_015011 [Malus domestica]|uniref:uncharacterized protein isoform X1 n=2 Tax=Malus domestica TaxID=3750 RepID=UPI000498CBE9|nr:uncharacterized protein LOC103414245 [Malus domestica]